MSPDGCELQTLTILNISHGDGLTPCLTSSPPSPPCSKGVVRWTHSSTVPSPRTGWAPGNALGRSRRGQEPTSLTRQASAGLQRQWSSSPTPGGSPNWTPVELGAWVPRHTQRPRGHTHTHTARWETPAHVAPRTQGADFSPPGERTEEVLWGSNQPKRNSPEDPGFQRFQQMAP